MSSPEELFTNLPATFPRGSRRWSGVSASVAVHLGFAVVAVGFLIFAPLELPETGEVTQVFFFNPAPPPPPPLPKGMDANLRVQQPKPVTTKPSDELEQQHLFVAPIEVPVRPPHPDPGATDQQAGSPNGSDQGVPEGSELGVVGGQIGGVPGGILGGIVGGTGTDLVNDPDLGPRLIKQTKPVYPQDAFVQKISGQVLVEITIDARGYVVGHRILHSIPQLDAAAIACVYQWRFAPAIKHGRPVATIANAPVTFTTL
jgi:periplasmic protein TonB